MLARLCKRCNMRNAYEHEQLVTAAQQAFTSLAWYNAFISLSMLGTNNDTMLLLNSSKEAINHSEAYCTIANRRNSHS